MNPKCVVASTSAHKLRAAEDALGIEAVLGCKTISDVNEQPIGLEETARGAVNRLRAAKEAHPDADLWIAMESGLLVADPEFKDAGRNLAVDITVIAVQTKTGEQSTSTSAGIPFPMETVLETRRRGFDAHTV